MDKKSRLFAVIVLLVIQNIAFGAFAGDATTLATDIENAKKIGQPWVRAGTFAELGNTALKLGLKEELSDIIVNMRSSVKEWMLKCGNSGESKGSELCKGESFSFYHAPLEIALPLMEEMFSYTTNSALAMLRNMDCFQDDNELRKLLPILVKHASRVRSMPQGIERVRSFNNLGTFIFGLDHKVGLQLILEGARSVNGLPSGYGREEAMHSNIDSIRFMLSRYDQGSKTVGDCDLLLQLYKTVLAGIPRAEDKEHALSNMAFSDNIQCPSMKTWTGVAKKEAAKKAHEESPETLQNKAFKLTDEAAKLAQAGQRDKALELYRQAADTAKSIYHEWYYYITTSAVAVKMAGSGFKEEARAEFEGVSKYLTNKYGKGADIVLIPDIKKAGFTDMTDVIVKNVFDKIDQDLKSGKDPLSISDAGWLYRGGYTTEGSKLFQMALDRSYDKKEDEYSNMYQLAEKAFDVGAKEIGVTALSRATAAAEKLKSSSDLMNVGAMAAKNGLKEEAVKAYEKAISYCLKKPARERDNGLSEILASVKGSGLEGQVKVPSAGKAK